MSFMSDKSDTIDSENAQRSSEAVFLTSNDTNTTEGRRSYWENAKKLLKEFLVEHEPSAVGLQEMNITESGHTGTNAIQLMLNTIPKLKYSIECKWVEAFGSKIGISIIYNKSKIGEFIAAECINNPNQQGRPLLMLLTEKDDKQYLSISIHGAQNPNLRLNKDEFNKYMLEINKKFVEEKANTFLIENNVQSLAGIFVMGDFNDRYDAITELVINGQTVEYKGIAPKSCCHNWDSSCPDTEVEMGTHYSVDGIKTYKGHKVEYGKLGPCDMFIYENKLYTKQTPIQNKTFNDDEEVEKYWGQNNNTCKEPPETERIIDGLKIPLLDDRGKIKNYKYAGDKVFGLNPKSNLEIFKYDERKGKRSIESDHELVFATVGELTAEVVDPATLGGKRRSRKTNQRSRKARRTNRKTRKSSRKSKHANRK